MKLWFILFHRPAGQKNDVIAQKRKKKKKMVSPNDLFQASRNPVRKIKVYKMKISIQSSATIDSQ